MQKQSPMLRLWQLGASHHSGLVRAIVSASLGVLGGMLPYFAAAQIIIGLLSGRTGYGFYAAWCLVALAGFCLRALLYALALSMSHKATFSILKEIRELILQKLPKMPLGTVMDTPSGEMKQVIVDQVESMERPLAHLLPEMTSNLLAPVCILLYLFFLDWRMALLSIVSIPVGMALMMGVMKNYGKQYEGSVKVTQAMNATIVEYIGGIEVIKAFNQGKNSYAKFAQRVRANAAYFYNWMKSCQLPISFSKAISPTTLITILPVGWLLYQSGSLSVETFITVIILSLGIAGPLLAAMDFVDSLAKVGTIVGEVDAILNGEEQIHATRPVSLPNRDIAVERVSFGYHEDAEVLHDVSLSIPSGSMVAFVGPSGGGKSTIAKLIGGFWDVKKGRITLGGRDLRDIPLAQLYSKVAFVSQDNYLFDDTVRENIRMGRLDASDTEVEAVARAAGCDAFIRALENGYDTKVGGGGAHLSGGERQRIAIARAMLKNAPIVILDEATAYIDPENEAVVQRAVAKLVEDKTVIVIAHRLSTITDADRIFVIDGGRVTASGTHEQLLKDSELYREMWRAHIGAKDGDAA
ncbi:MAG TPA: ABC transporter ATP-binding protein [Candidatus Pullichristensenella stercorigallinarum]|uniref:ABC transporter ATP-binding protein n=1 Tax=Candidatus Pullichristensenella stercorigallinarum TaxID=2840909 RepID=A0A9D1CXV6_9FIRM|nr:ABC transporter ATP-binding protein [Candidatus Pullichristensenella stercorigallinarum]